MATTARRAMGRRAARLLAAALLAALPFGAAAGDRSWPARTAVSAAGGPVPHGRNSWKQCAVMTVRNPEGMAAGRWAGALAVRGGALLSATGVQHTEEAASGRYRLRQGDGTPDVVPGGEDAVEFCVAYASSWSATADISFELSSEDEDLFVEVQPGGAGRMLMKRQTAYGPGMFVSDYSTGQCRCKAMGGGVPPPVQDVPPANVQASTIVRTSTATSTVAATSTQAFSTSVTSATATATRTPSTTSRTQSTTSLTTAAPSSTPTLIASEGFDYNDWNVAGRAGGTGWQAAWYASSVHFTSLGVTSGALYYAGSASTIRASSRMLSTPVNATRCRRAFVQFECQFGTQNGYGTPTFRLVNGTHNVVSVGNNGYGAANYGLLNTNLESVALSSVPFSNRRWVLVELDYAGSATRMYLSESEQGVDPPPAAAGAAASLGYAPTFAGFDIVVRELGRLDNIKVYCEPNS
ncbi:hypothetical protein DFJ74DRAFT_697461 [Hyaloraphidium curvatum]|nr:hypothetical protein DFJ74DRAFT_697461 [Hyaloraphidium curvatum]